MVPLSAQGVDENDRKFVLGPSNAMREVVKLAHLIATDDPDRKVLIAVQDTRLGIPPGPSTPSSKTATRRSTEASALDSRPQENR